MAFSYLNQCIYTLCNIFERRDMCHIMRRHMSSYTDWGVPLYRKFCVLKSQQTATWTLIHTDVWCCHYDKYQQNHVTNIRLIKNMICLDNQYYVVRWIFYLDSISFRMSVSLNADKCWLCCLAILCQLELWRYLPTLVMDEILPKYDNTLPK